MPLSLIVPLSGLLLAAVELVPQVPHPSSVTHTAISDDHRFIATRSINDSRVRLWDVASGLIARTLDVDRAIDGLVFAKDTLLVMGDGGLLRFDLKDWQSTPTLYSDVYRVHHGAMTPDATRALVVSSSEGLRLVDLTQRGTPRERRVFRASKPVETPHACRTAQLSDDGARGLCVANTGPISVLDLNGGGSKQLSGIKALEGALSADGKVFAYINSELDAVTLVDANTLRPLATAKNPPFKGTPNGSEWPALRVTRDEVVLFFVDEVRRWKRSNLAPISSQRLVDGAQLKGVAFDRSGEWLSSGADERYTSRWVRATDEPQAFVFQVKDKAEAPARIFAVPKRRPAALAWTDGGVLLAQRFRQRARVTSLATAQTVWEDSQRLRLPERAPGAAALSVTGRYAAFAAVEGNGGAKEAFVVDLESKRTIALEVGKLFFDWGVGLAFSPDEATVLIATSSAQHLLSARSGALLYTHKGSDILQPCRFAARAPRLLCTPKYEGKEPSVLVDTSTGKVLATLNGTGATLSADGTTIAMTPHGATREKHFFSDSGAPMQTPIVKDWCDNRRTLFLPFEPKPDPQWSACGTVSEMVWSAAPVALRHDVVRNELQVINGTGVLVRVPMTTAPKAAQASADGKRLIVGSVDGESLLIDLAEKRLGGTVVTGQEDWVVAAPDNHYAASKGSVRLLGFRDGSTLYGARDLDLTLNRPDLVLPRLGATPATQAELTRIANKRRQRLGNTPQADRPTVALEQPLPLATTQSTLPLSAVATGAHPLKLLHVWINDVPAVAPITLAGTSQRAETTLVLSAGPNRIDVAAEDARGAQSLRATWIVERQTDKEAQPSRYVLALGVSDYADQDLDLTYAAKDADDLSKALTATLPPARVHLKLLRDGEVTRANLQAAKAFFKGASVDDELIVFLAGHGFLDARDDYWFGSADVDPNNPADKGIAFADIEALFDDARARKRWLLLDTCHSGEVDRDAEASIEALPPGIKARGFRVKAQAAAAGSAQQVSRFIGELFSDLRPGVGATVLSSSSGLQLSQESATYQNGLFTYALLSALRDPMIDSNQSGALELAEVRDAVVDTVRKLSAGLQIPNARRENDEANFVLKLSEPAPAAGDGPKRKTSKKAKR